MLANKKHPINVLLVQHLMIEQVLYSSTALASSVQKGRRDFIFHTPKGFFGRNLITFTTPHHLVYAIRYRKNLLFFAHISYMQAKSLIHRAGFFYMKSANYAIMQNCTLKLLSSPIFPNLP